MILETTDYYNAVNTKRSLQWESKTNINRNHRKNIKCVGHNVQIKSSTSQMDGKPSYADRPESSHLKSFSVIVAINVI